MCVQTTCSRVILGGLSAEQRNNKHSRNRKSFPGGVTITTEITSPHPARSQFAAMYLNREEGYTKGECFCLFAIKLEGVSSYRRAEAAEMGWSGGVARDGLG